MEHDVGFGVNGRLVQKRAVLGSSHRGSTLGSEVVLETFEGLSVSRFIDENTNESADHTAVRPTISADVAERLGMDRKRDKNEELPSRNFNLPCA